MISPSEALERLVAGNRRFVSGTPGVGPVDDEVRAGLVGGQSPFAAILACADSRVPVETVFDQGPGELFVVRVAGNIAAPSQIGSLEYAAEQLGTRLIVVLGHTGCGAIQAALEMVELPHRSLSEGLRSVIKRIGPSLEALVTRDSEEDEVRSVAAQAVRANVRASVDTLSGSPVLADLIREDGLVVLGAEYSLATGDVDFFTGLDHLGGSSDDEA